MAGDESEASETKHQPPRSGLTSTGVPWNEVPACAVLHVEYIDGVPQSQKNELPDMESVPVPEVLVTLPVRHPDRPLGSKMMIDASGARTVLSDARPGAWMVSPYTGWKWAKWPNGDVGWLPKDVTLPDALCVTVKRL